ncbi:MAG: esterase family protein [Bacteroidetes bacterium]|nr:esterase family protein [Bacteroidota bacterium]
MKTRKEVPDNQGLKSFVTRQKINIYSSFLKRVVQVQLLAFEDGKKVGKRGLLLLNDGQDLEKLELEKTLRQFAASGTTIPFIVVAISAGERKSEYGVSGSPDYLGRGNKAHLYEDFIIHELLPWIKSHTGHAYTPELTAFAGCSLGGLSALDVAISNPHHFGMVGVFSGSIWWRSKGYEEGYTDNDRIILSKLKELNLANHFRCWLMAGTNDEKNDRNRSGIIDAVEDTLDLFELLHKKMTTPIDRLTLRIIDGGNHNPATWASHFPDFLHTAFNKQMHPQHKKK